MAGFVAKRPAERDFARDIDMDDAGDRPDDEA